MRVCAVAVFLLPIFAFAQSTASISPTSDRTASLHYYFTLFSQADGKLAPSFEPVEDFIARIQQKRSHFKKEKAFLHHLFTKTHHDFLKQYDEFASFSGLISSGKYNCLGATALYSLLLDHFGIRHKVIETNYHIYILAATAEGSVLLESTDPVNGFIDNPEAIRARMEKYQEQRVEQVSNSKHQFNYSVAYADSVTMPAMLGLLHYNHSVKAFNEKKFDQAIRHLHHALLLRRTAKLDAFLDLMITTVTYSDQISQATKENHLTRLQTLQKKKSANLTTLMIPLVR